MGKQVSISEHTTASRQEHQLTPQQRRRVAAGLVATIAMVGAGIYGTALGIKRHKDAEHVPAPTGEYVNIWPAYSGEGPDKIAADLANGAARKELAKELKQVMEENGGVYPNDAVGVDTSLINETDADVLKQYDIARNEQGEPYNPGETE